ncbi:MAG: T9SS type A sorting domain-containing protein [Saprospiraceae bacterium]
MKNLTFLCLLCFLLINQIEAQNTVVLGGKKISANSGNFTGQLDIEDQFGAGVTDLGDLNGDGFEDIIVTANLDDDSGTDQGAIWVLFLDANHDVQSHQKISAGYGGFTGITDGTFGSSIEAIGDLDNDGVVDIAVGENRGNDGGNHTGAIWILFLNTNGTVKAHQKISMGHGNFTGTFPSGGRLGSIAAIGDINGDNVVDLAVGTSFDHEDGHRAGSVWILFLNTNGTVNGYQKINESNGNFGGDLDPEDYFGISVASIGDLNNDGVTDILVGARGDDDGGFNRGAVYILYLNTNGTVATTKKISSITNNFTNQVDDEDFFGTSADNIGDFDGDGVADIMVGAYLDDDGGTNRGAVYLIFLNADGSVKTFEKISSTQGGFNIPLQDGDLFSGFSVSLINDLNGDGAKDIIVSAFQTNDGGWNKGAVWLLYLNGKISTSTEGQTESFQANNLTAYPNPNHGQFTLDGFQKTNFDIRIYNVSGQLVQDFRVDEPVEQLEIYIETKGVYFLEYTDSDNLRIVKKIIVLE